MHEHAAKARQQAERLQGLGTAFGMGEVGRQVFVGEHVQPLKLPAHAHAGLIGMGDRRGDQRLADGGYRRFQVLGRRLDGGVEGARGDGDPGQLVEHRGRALEGQQLVLRHVDRERRHARPVLKRCADRLGKLAAVPAPAGAGTGNGAVFCDLATDDQLDDLTPLRRELNRDLRSAAPPVTGALERDDNLVLRVVHEGTRCP